MTEGIADVPEVSTNGGTAGSGPDEAFGVAGRHERARGFLSPGEETKLLNAAKAGRHCVRDYLLLPMTDRHSLWVSEASGLRDDMRRLRASLVHRGPRHTAHDTRIAGRRFEGLWR